MGKLARSETDRKIAGIAGGMAAYSGLDPTLVRVVWVVGALMGWGLLGYLLLWIALPKGPVPSRAVRIAEERFARGEISADDRIAYVRPSEALPDDQTLRVEIGASRGRWCSSLALREGSVEGWSRGRPHPPRT